MALSSQEFERLKAQLLTRKSITGSAPTAPPAQGPGFMEGVQSAFQKRNTAFDEARAKSQSGEQSKASGLLQTVGHAAGFVGDVVGEGIKAIPGAEAAIGAVAKPIVQSQPVQSAMAQYSTWKQQNPEAAANLEAAVNIGTLLPIGKAAQIATKTAGNVAGTAVKAVGSATAATGRASEGIGRTLYGTAFNHSKQTAEHLLDYKANTPFITRATNTLTGKETAGKPRLKGDTGLEKGISGTETMVGVQAKRQANTLWEQKIKPAVEGSGAVITKEELFSPAQALIAKTTDPTRRKALQNAFDALQDDYANVTQFTLAEAQALKRDIANFIPEKMYRGENVASSLKTLQHEMASYIRKRTYDELADVNIRQDYLDWANLDELADVGVKALSEAGFKGGFGGFWSAVYDMATTPVKTVGGQMLYRVGNLFEFTGEKGIKKFGDFLNGRGLERPTTSGLGATAVASAQATPENLSQSTSASPQPTMDKEAALREAVNKSRELTESFGPGGLARATTKLVAPVVAKGLSKIHPDDLRVLERFIDAVRLKKGEMADALFDSAEKLAQKFGISMDKGLKGVANAFDDILQGKRATPDTVVQPRDAAGRFK